MYDMYVSPYIRYDVHEGAPVGHCIRKTYLRPPLKGALSSKWTRLVISLVHFVQFLGPRSTLLAAQAQGAPNAIVRLLAALTMEEQLRLLQLMKAPTSPALHAGSVLDSGSSKHLHSQVQVPHSDDLTSITGFESNTKPTWTQGTGYLPLTACDAVTGQPRSFDVSDLDKLSTVALDILSLGKLIRANWSFYVESADNLVAVTPDKRSRFRVELGDDDILRLPHEMRSGRQSAPLPEILQQKAQVLHAKRVTVAA